MRTFAYLIDFSQSAMFFLPLFPSCNFAFINICLYTVPPSVFWSLCYSTSLNIIVKYFTYSSFTKPEGMSKKNSNNTIGNRTRNVLACSEGPQPTASPRAPACKKK